MDNVPLKVFQAASWPRYFVLFFWTGIVSFIGVLDFLTGQKVVGSIAVSMCLLPFFPLVLLVHLTSRIKIGNGYVEKITIAGRRRIEFADIKSYGVYVSVGSVNATMLRFAPFVVDASEAEEGSFFLAQYTIFISTEANFVPVNYYSKDRITFEFRKDIYQHLNEVLNGIVVR